MISLSLIVVGQWMPDDEPSWFESLAISKQNQICQIYGAPVQSGQELPKPLSSFISRPPAIQFRKFPAFPTRESQPWPLSESSSSSLVTSPRLWKNFPNTGDKGTGPELSITMHEFELR